MTYTVPKKPNKGKSRLLTAAAKEGTRAATKKPTATKAVKANSVTRIAAKSARNVGRAVRIMAGGPVLAASRSRKIASKVKPKRK